MKLNKILVIGSVYFEPGFRILESDGFAIDYYDKDNVWGKLNLFQKSKILAKHDVAHYFWARVRLIELLLAKLLLKNVIFHYIGSDVLLVLKQRRKVIVQKILSHFFVKCYAGSDQLVNELQEHNIKCQTLNFVNRAIGDYEFKYSPKLKVLTMIPDGKEEFYGLDSIIYCAKRMPDTEFLILKNSKNYPYRNIKTAKYIKWEDMIDLFNEYNVYVRTTKHDSLSTSVLEALACGRHVIWTHSFPHCFLARTGGELYNLLSNKAFFRNSNHDGKIYVMENYSFEKIKAQYERVWES